MKVLTMLLLASVLGLSSAVARADCTRDQQGHDDEGAGSDRGARPGKSFTAGQDTALRKAGNRQEGRRAQGLHEDLPVEQEGVRRRDCADSIASGR
jgi:hypothetical protein